MLRTNTDLILEINQKCSNSLPVWFWDTCPQRMVSFYYIIPVELSTYQTSNHCSKHTVTSQEDLKTSDENSPKENKEPVERDHQNKISLTTIRTSPFVLQGATGDLAMSALQDPQRYSDQIVSSISTECLQQLALLQTRIHVSIAWFLKTYFSSWNDNTTHQEHEQSPPCSLHHQKQGEREPHGLLSS